MNTVWKRYLALFALATAALTSTAAYAGTDWKTYPAAMCHTDGLVIRNEYGAICNNHSNHDVTVDCPIVRDMASSRWPTHIRHSGRTGNSNIALRCSVRSMKRSGTNAGGGIGLSFAYLTYITTPNAYGASGRYIFDQQTSFAHINNNVLPMQDYGPMMMSCVLPRREHLGAKSCLTAYSVREWDGR